MNFQQLRSVREAVRCGFNLTEVAAALHTSQPGVSRQVRELEEELGVELFERAGKRLLGLTSAGKALLPIVERVLLDADSLRRAGQELQGREEGRLSIAATHSQARYALPHVVRDFRQRWPRVSLHLHQGSPKQVAEMLLSGEADVGIGPERTPAPRRPPRGSSRWRHTRSRRRRFRGRCTARDDRPPRSAPRRSHTPARGTVRPP
ncbi:MAG: LysR family transcriptional regulator, partial [Burkholderiales bacterium]|nr:LysR family transcriptional regulator [Burkholderiales bacterium]